MPVQPREVAVAVGHHESHISHIGDGHGSRRGCRQSAHEFPVKHIRGHPSHSLSHVRALENAFQVSVVEKRKKKSKKGRREVLAFTPNALGAAEYCSA